ncbi:DeoR/GlpR family DNA-binding transcription regulator [Microbacterium sp. MPKO10]|uniref:DeoR/GlpR family DNA-binding transcription regulator n=1 Tax=Microbacterium sp. MPKO10 TaxID=2989818 RepID=UPI00223640B1|nr:DeoR/GlpR family DNA-binding transcription regulator [Microbacterium sp. MPKO10]MCW4457711.1 DeoR/GlpR family DNA-binding transcription regulator [Microbacterium sp. MPKO10]
MTDADSLPAEVRRDRIRARLDTRGYVRAADIAHDFAVSSVTARADLDALVEVGVARRVHGGAVAAGAAPEVPVEQSVQTGTESKRAIGRRAASLVDAGQSVFLDVGSTALAVAEALVERTELHDVVVVTNGISTALALEPALPRISVYVTGGALRPLQHSLVNPMGQQLIESVHADVAILGCNGVDVEAGVTNVNLPEAEIKRAMVAASDRVIVTADASKLGRVTMGHVAELARVDTIVTDAAADPRVIDNLRAAGAALLLA